MYHFKKKVLIPSLGRVTLTTFPYISLYSKIDATSPLTISLLSIQKRDYFGIKLLLEYPNCFRVPGFWTSLVDVVIYEAPVSALLPQLGDMFLPSRYSLFI